GLKHRNHFRYLWYPFEATRIARPVRRLDFSAFVQCHAYTTAMKVRAQGLRQSPYCPSRRDISRGARPNEARTNRAYIDDMPAVSRAHCRQESACEPRGKVVWRAGLGARDRADNALDDFFERHRLIVVIANVH